MKTLAYSVGTSS